VATSNPNKNGFSSPLSWRAQAYKMENGRERYTKRNMDLFPQALTLLQALNIALLELQNVQDTFPYGKQKKKGHLTHQRKMAHGGNLSLPGASHQTVGNSSRYRPVVS